MVVSKRIYIVSPLPMLHLFLQFQATSSNSSFGEPGPHPIHTGRTFFLPGKTNKLKMMCLSQKIPFISSSIRFQVETNLVFPRSFSIGIIPAAPEVVQRKKNTKRPRWVLWSPASRLQLRKSQENDPAWSSIKQIGRHENGLRVDGEELVSPKKGLWQRKKTHVNKQTKATKSET